jgi:hypothetical protein
MPIRLQCPGCKKVLAIQDRLAGKRVKCPCGNPIQVPAKGMATATGPMPVGRPPVKPTAKPALKSKPIDLEALAAESLGLGAAPNGDDTSNGKSAATTTPPNGVPAAKPIVFKCDFCEEEISLDVSEGGKKLPCPHCTRIIRVPMPKEEKPKDWRTVQTKGPSAALANQPEKLENAWGTEHKAQVSKSALVEAGVVAKPVPKKAPLDERIARWVKIGLAVALLIGVTLWLRSVGMRKNDEKNVVNLEKKYQELGLAQKWPPVVSAEFYRILGEHALSVKPKQASERFIEARDFAAQGKDEKQRLDRDFFLIDLAKVQLALGGDETQVINDEKLSWERDLPLQLQQTLYQLDNIDGKNDPKRYAINAINIKLIAIRELKQPLLQRNQEAIFTRLVADLGLADRENGAAPPPNAEEGSYEQVVKAESLAREGKIPEALKPAEAKGGDFHLKIEIAIAVAMLVASESPDQADKLAAPIKLARELVLGMPKEQTPPPWAHLQLVRIGARMPDEAEAMTKVVERFKDKGFAQRAKFELKLARLEKAPIYDEASTIIQDIEPDGQGLAWLAWARSTARANGRIDAPSADEQHFDFLVGAAKQVLVKAPAK